MAVYFKARLFFKSRAEEIFLGRPHGRRNRLSRPPR